MHVLGRVATGGLAALACGACACGWSPPPAPAQPIPFSHKVHVTDNLVGCTSCHVYAEHSTVAGIPSMQRCQGCHKFVKQDPQNPTLTAELKPLLRYLEEDKPVEWTRVHRLPDHVFFTHERHVAAGLRCQECHGEVEKMTWARQVAPLTMGWCLACHQRKQGEAPGRLAKLTDCWTCHK